MPMYRYRCPFCLMEADEFRKMAEMDDAPTCHNRKMERVILPTMVSVFHPYQSVAADKESQNRPFIRTRAEHESFLRRNGYEEIGNDKSMAPRSPEEILERRQRAAADDAAAPMVDVDKLKKEGWIEEAL